MDHDQNIEIQLEHLTEVTDLCTSSRRALRHYNGGNAKVGLTARLIPAAEKDRLSLLLQVSFTDMEKETRPLLLREACLCEFSVINLSRHVDMSDVSLRVPHHLLTLMLSVALGALRGMVAVRAAGTRLAEYPIPVMNISHLATQLHNPASAVAV